MARYRRALGALLLLPVVACGTDTGSATSVTFLLRSQGGTTYFQQVADGARAEAQRLGLDLAVQFTDSSDQQLSAADTAIAAGADGLIVTIQDPAIGPAIAAKASAAGIPLLASPDSFDDAAGDPVPVVALDGEQVGADVGAEAARLHQDSGWDPAGVRVVSVELPGVSTCMDRTDGALAAFADAEPGLAESVLRVEYDGTLNSANDTVSAALNNHRDVRHWIVWSCNDEGVVGAITALANAGMGADRVIGVGLGANLACDQWAAGGASAYRSAVALDPRDNGRIAVATLHRHLTGGEPLPAVTLFTGELVGPDTAAGELPCG